jgi:hypothetical protein
MPPARRERDPRTGRYTSSRENTEDLAGPSGSVPGAFDEPTETTPGADETVEILEGIRDETRSASDIEEEDPSEQLQGELVSGILGARDLTSRMSEESAIPAYQAVIPQKIATFNIERLDWMNVSSWKA